MNSVRYLRCFPSQRLSNSLKAVHTETESCPIHGFDARLVQVDADGDSIARIPAVVQVIAVSGVVDIHVIVVVPVVRPVFRPRISKAEPKSAVLEARITTNHHHGVAVDSERVLRTKVAIVTVLWNAVPVVATALLPVAVLGLPVMCAMLLPGATLFAFLPVLLLLRLHPDCLYVALLL